MCVSFPVWQVALQAWVPEQKPPCSCTVPLITIRFIQQARSSCQWALLCMSVSLWRSNIRVLWLFWRIATPLSHQTPITPRGSTSSGTSVYHSLCCVMLTRQTCTVILGLFHLPWQVSHWPSSGGCDWEWRIPAGSFYSPVVSDPEPVQQQVPSLQPQSV